MKILGIETSCDETAAAIVQDGTTVFSNVVASSEQIHTETGGIVPESAAREQIKSIIPVIEQSLVQASSSLEEIDAVAVTFGPGLVGSLLVGVESAKTLSTVLPKPLIPVNHMVGHIYGAWISQQTQPKFPLVVLVVSGGHTDLIYMRGHGVIEWLGSTRDDAAGEAFDKTARLLELGYPGGPAISKAADTYLEKNTDMKLDLFPRPMIASDDYDFSFSGLKTAVYNTLKEQESRRVEVDANYFAAEIQEAICDVLISKSLKAIGEFKVDNFILCGGVAANRRLRDKFAESLPQGVHFFVPEIKYCTDNAAMIAAAAYFNQNFVSALELSANPQLTISD